MKAREMIGQLYDRTVEGSKKAAIRYAPLIGAGAGLALGNVFFDPQTSLNHFAEYPTIKNAIDFGVMFGGTSLIGALGYLGGCAAEFKAGGYDHTENAVIEDGAEMDYNQEKDSRR